MDVSRVVEDLNSAVAKLNGMYDTLCQSVQIDNNYNTVIKMREKMTHIQLWLESLATSIPKNKDQINKSMEKLGIQHTR